MSLFVCVFFCSVFAFVLFLLELHIFKEKEPDTVNEDQKTEEASEPEPAEHKEERDLVGDHTDVAEDNENATANSAGSDEEKPE